MVAVFRGWRSFWTAENRIFKTHRVDNSQNTSLTILLHAAGQTALESARLTLIPMRLVDGAGTGARLTPINETPSNAALEKPGATVACQNSVLK